jgi:hypothetical protein
MLKMLSYSSSQYPIFDFFEQSDDLNMACFLSCWKGKSIFAEENQRFLPDVRLK